MNSATCTPRESEMAFREKRAWIVLASQVLTFGSYFLFAPRPLGMTGMAILERLSWFTGALVAQGLILGIGLSLLTQRMPASERGRPDERDRAIERNATSIAYVVLVCATILVGIVMPFSHRGWEIIDASIAALVVAEAVRQIAIITGYRRGWHG